jgi:uncharacterized protein YndB with AHSA1/START domain
LRRSILGSAGSGGTCRSHPTGWRSASTASTSSVPDERVVTTEIYEGLPEGVSEEEAATVNTATFAEADGRTTLTILVQATSKESRDAIIESGMEAGLQDALDLLEQLALSLR